MGSLHEIAIRAFVVIFLSLRIGTCAETYCSLSVRIISPPTLEFVPSVLVQEKDGRNLRQEPNQGIATFCDLGLLPVTVTVSGEGACNQVVVKNVNLAWGEERLVEISYDPTPCFGHSPPPPKPLCEVLYRIVDSSNQPIADAAVTVAGEDQTVSQSDSFGRAHFWRPIDPATTATISAPGYTSVSAETKCSLKERKVEVKVPLSRTTTPRPGLE
jgi:hypothetical protein